MSRLLITSGKNAADLMPPADAIDWDAVERVWVQTFSSDDPSGFAFGACIVFTDGTWVYANTPGTALAARSAAACLGAERDKPVQDWTRPAPAAHAWAAFVWALRDHVSPASGWEIPEEEPKWAPGWDSTDHLFTQGVSDDEFAAEMLTIENACRRTFEDVADISRVEKALRIRLDEARSRWRVLNAANVKPAPVFS